MADLGWAGGLAIGEHDRLAVMDSNVGWSKADRNVRRRVEYRLDLREPTAPTSELSLRYDNTGIPSADSCDIQAPPPASGFDYDTLKNSCYWNFVRAYTALGAELVGYDPLPLPAGSIAHRTNIARAGDSTLARGFDGNGTYFSGLLSVAPGETREAAMSFRLPEGVVQVTERGLEYRLDLISQSGSRGREIEVEIQLPAGHDLATASPEPTSVDGQFVTFSFDLTSDRSLEISTVSSTDAANLRARSIVVAD